MDTNMQISPVQDLHDLYDGMKLHDWQDLYDIDHLQYNLTLNIFMTFMTLGREHSSYICITHNFTT